MLDNDSETLARRTVMKNASGSILSTDTSNLSEAQNRLEEGSRSSETRRSMLKKSGLTAFGLSGFIKKLGISSFNPSTRIVAARGGPNAEPRVTRKVPKKWLKHQQALRKVVERLRTKYESKDFVGTLCYVPSERMDGGVYYGQPEISVRPDADPSLVEKLPETVEDSNVKKPDSLVVSDIKIRRMNGEFALMNVDCYDEVTNSLFPGGLYFRNDNYKFGTSGFRVSDGSDEYMYTANHVVKGGNCSCCVPDARVYDTVGNYIGWVHDGHKTHDWCIIDDCCEEWSNRIQFEERSVSVDGWVTKSGVDYLEGHNGAIRQQGVISGYQEGQVKGNQASYYNFGCIKMFGKAVKVGIPAQTRSGDSGGPIWWPNSDGNYMITVLTGAETNGSYSGCGVSGSYGNPSYGYSVWRTFNNTDLYCG